MEGLRKTREKSRQSASRLRFETYTSPAQVRNNIAWGSLTGRFLGSWQLFRTSVSYQHCMETEGLLQITQQTATEPKYKLHKMKPRQGCSNVLTQKKIIWKQIILVWVGQAQPIWSVNGIWQTVTKCLSIKCAYRPQNAHHIYSYSLCNFPCFHGGLLKSQSSGFLCNVQSYVCTDVSGERAFSILKVMERESVSKCRTKLTSNTV